MIEVSQLPASEVVQLAAADSIFYTKYFFPRLAKQDSAPFHLDVWDMIEDPQHRYVALKMFRGSAKTSILRVFTSKRIAFGISRTIIFVSASQAHSVKSVLWLKSQVENNTIWATIFGLERGEKWTEDWIQIVNTKLGITINVLALGITGQIRGINIEDHRPDLIVADDPCDEENTGTDEQLHKTSERFFGALAQSLTPASENPHAKLVLLQTPLAPNDLIARACKLNAFASREYSCFAADGGSTWPARFPTDYLLEEKNKYREANQMPTWYREMEVTIVAEETSSFKAEWLGYWHAIEPGARIPAYMAIDPLPPPSAKEKANNFKKKDFEVLAVVGIWKGGYYVLDIARNQGHDPSWTVAQFFSLAKKWGILECTVEGIAYQRTLKWILEQEMMRRREYYVMYSEPDNRSKPHVIKQALTRIAQHGKFFIHPGQKDLEEQFINYPRVPHDDDIDAVARAVERASRFENMGVSEQDIIAGGIGVSNKRMERILESWCNAP